MRYDNIFGMYEMGWKRASYFMYGLQLKHDEVSKMVALGNALKTSNIPHTVTLQNNVCLVDSKYVKPTTSLI